MKTLLILRHAKSSWKFADLDDHERPLNKRGKRDAPKMAKKINDEGLCPDLILCSTAVRARAIADEVVQCCQDSKIKYVKDLYLADPEEILQVVSKHQGDTLMVVGHNPGMEDLVTVLTEEEEFFPTSALAQVELAIDDWKQVQTAKGRLKCLWRPKEVFQSTETGP